MRLAFPLACMSTCADMRTVDPCILVALLHAANGAAATGANATVTALSR